MITTGATVVTSPGSLPRCMGALTVILYKIREFGSWAVFLHLVMRDWRKKKGAERHNTKIWGNKVVQGKSLSIGLEHFPAHRLELN